MPANLENSVVATGLENVSFHSKFLIGGYCFIMLFWVLPYINMNQPYVYIYSLPLETPSYPCPISSHQVIAEHQDEVPASYRKFQLAIYFTYDYVYVSMLLSQLIPSFPSPAVSTSMRTATQCLWNFILYLESGSRTAIFLNSLWTSPLYLVLCF